MNAFENWLKEHDALSEKLAAPDPDQIIAGVQARIQRRKLRRRLSYSMATVAAFVLITVFSVSRIGTTSTPEMLSVTQTNLFDDKFVESLMDSSEFNDLYWSAAEYVMGINGLNQPLPDIQLTATEIEAFKAFLEKQNS